MSWSTPSVRIARVAVGAHRSTLSLVTLFGLALATGESPAGGAAAVVFLTRRRAPR